MTFFAGAQFSRNFIHVFINQIKYEEIEGCKQSKLNVEDLVLNSMY